MKTTPSFLTPSEHVYLHGEKFSPKSGFLGKTRLLHMEYDVKSVELVQAMISAAFLTLDLQGTLRLEMRAKKVLFGLSSTQALYADAVGPAADWPAHTIEASLPGLAAQLAQNKGQNEVYAILYTWLGQDFNGPFEEVLTRVKKGMVTRGLLEAHQEKTLKIFTRTVFTLPATTLQLAQNQSIAPIQRLFEDCQNQRPELWKRLNEQIKKAIVARQEKSDTDTD